MSTTKGSDGNRPILEKLRYLQLFRRFNDTDLKLMVDYLEEEHYEMGKILFQTGEPYRKLLFILYRGRVGLWGPQGEKYEVDPGAVLGLSNFMDGLPFTFTAIALTPISLLVVRDAEHHELERLCPPLHRMLFRLIAGRVSQQTTRQSFVGDMTQVAKVAMKTPLATCGPDLSLSQAHRIMAERKISSLVVTSQEEELLGVVTFPGLSEAVLVKGAAPDDKVMNVACRTAYAVSSDTPLWEVEEIQRRNALKYVIVTEENRPIGIISQTDILNTLLAQSGGMRDEVRNTDSFTKLVKLTKRLISIVEDAREHNNRTSEAVRVISEFHLALQRRCAELTLQEMAKNGQGKPPEKFAVLIMGSGGRKEMMLNPVQQNGILIDGPSKRISKKTRRWFLEFARQLNQHLDDLGYAICPDDVLAGNPMFNKTLEEWCDQIKQLLDAPDRKAARWLSLFLDFDKLYGDDDLTETLRQHVRAEIDGKPGLLKMLAEDNAGCRPPLGFFNQLIATGSSHEKSGNTAKGKIDIKTDGLRIMVDILRIYALRAGIRNCNTIDRLEGLVRQGELNAGYANSIQVAYEALSELLLVHMLQQAKNGKRLDKLIKPKQLSALDHATLRISLCTIKGFQERLQSDMR